jgi:hypothetical protein
MNKIINVIDMCILYSRNFNIDYFLIKFYDISEISINKQYYIDKLNLLRNDFTSFWLSLDDDNKEKFIMLVKDHKNDKNEYNLKYIDKLCIRVENNKEYLMFINNNVDIDDIESDN